MKKGLTLVLLLFIFTLDLFSQNNISQVNLICTGDIFPGFRMLAGGIQANGKRDYNSFYSEVKPYIEGADIATGWFGGPLAAPGENVSGYPKYNNPPEFIQAQKDAGYDIIFHTNHLLDHDIDGLFRTLRFFKKIGMVYLGGYETEEQSKNTLIINTNNIKIAFLSYLYGANGNFPPKGMKWAVNFIVTNKIKSDIEKARQNADFVIVAMHWGVESERQPNLEQTSLATNMALWGADMILGSHPHVIEPAGMIETALTNGKTRKTFVIYSMGNFLSSQTNRYSDCGLMLHYQVEKNSGTGETYLKKISYIPTWVLWKKDIKKQKWSLKIYPTQEGMRAFSSKTDPALTRDDYDNMKLSWDDTLSILDKPDIGFFHEDLAGNEK
jgi:poly-gamma-glutamate capsule biosynthesis protein CapA/YwtB (metallophosphatase superfamily)